MIESLLLGPTSVCKQWWTMLHHLLTHGSLLKTQCKEALNLIRVVAHLKWGGDRHSWCCTVPLFVPSLTMVALCMAQHQTPTYDNWTAFITLDWDWHWEHSAPAQCPACTQRPTKLFGGTSVKAVHALLRENSCLHWQSSTSCPAWIRPNH